MTIHNPNCDRFYLPDADELVEFGGPSRDQIISRITFCHVNQTELKGREEIPVKAQGHEEFVGLIPAGPKEITTSLYWHHAPRGVPRPIPQAKTFVKEAYGVARYQVPSAKQYDPFSWPQVFRRETYDLDTNELIADHDYLDPAKEEAVQSNLPGGKRNVKTVFHYVDGVDAAHDERQSVDA